ncbi:DUF302 domain-containing protein [Nocardia sp. alder85J]|uniref:DUF302 domain-containing protein n=1 Tax=Nocardia sp. alder85J TaxID=2862949 RepID=UPI001CD67916|nr:DUF302 domain-containing protein [Nocardia sp. alder85J]MCX4094220.1 DUF302 domain-containing protein [Nocardia sp. alder85J]
MDSALSTTLRTSFEDAVRRTREALAEQGFGILTEIDVKATMHAKLGAELDDYLILGACNPPLALRAVTADPGIGLLLPCNVVVRAAGDGTVVVDAMDPTMMSRFSAAPEIPDIAAVATGKLAAAIATLTSG